MTARELAEGGGGAQAHVGPPVGGDDHQLGPHRAGPGHPLPQRRHRPGRDREVVGPGGRRGGFPAGLVVGEGHDAEPEPPGLQDRRAAGLLEVAPRPRVGDPRRLQQAQHLHEGLLPVVEHVVVGEGHAVDPGQLQGVHRHRVGPEVEDLGPAPPGRAAPGDDALEVHDAGAGPVQLGQDVAPGVGRAVAEQGLVDHPPQHRVPGQCDDHDGLSGRRSSAAAG